GNISVPYVEGVAVSGGTAYPELAYDLARTFAQAFDQDYVTMSPRRSISGQLENQMPDLSAELMETVQDAIENALPYSELRYREYLLEVFTLMQDDNLIASDALATLTLEAQSNMDTAINNASTTTIIVNQPEL